jgi:phosphoribosylformylglycinamidine (FGAM) synthase-like amidotransferase family enzyme
MKQTAVEWLYNNLKSHFEHDGDLLEVVKMSFDISKEMEKQQIVDAHIEGQRVFDNYQHTQWTTDQAEEYYKEIFKSE